MNRTVWKFPVSEIARGPQTIEMPQRSRILCVQSQNGSPVIWAVCNTRAPLENVRVLVVGTGMEFPSDDQCWSYLGTVQNEEWKLVWHIFVGCEFYCDPNRNP